MAMHGINPRSGTIYNTYKELKLPIVHFKNEPDETIYNTYKELKQYNNNR